MSRLKKFDFNEIISLAKGLRESMTESETILWKELKARKLSGFKFLRQHPIIYKGNLLRYNYFVADFYCAEKKAVIELDGPIHDETEDYDQFRDSELGELGIHVLRIKNEELDDMKEIKNKILEFLYAIKT